MLARKCLHDDRRSRTLESSQQFGIPEGFLEDSSLEAHLLPVLPRALRSLSLEDGHFDQVNFDHCTKQLILASILVYQKSSRSIKDGEKWTVAHNTKPSSARYAGPLDYASCKLI